MDLVTRMVFVMVAAFALWAIPSTAGAHAGNNDAQLLHVCIGNVSKIVRSVGVSGACITGPPVVAETADHWRKAGEKGDKGENGTNGINGIDGTSVTFVGYFSGTENGCANGGAIYAVGNPPVNTYVCNGQDGVNGVRADGPCFDNSNRYVNCLNGTVTDTVTGLIWLRDAGCLGAADWGAGNALAAALANGECDLTDGSSPGDWRLPTKDEWSKTLLNPGADGNLGCYQGGGHGPPSWTNDAGTACYGTGQASSFLRVAENHYWSSSTFEFGVDGIGALRGVYATLIFGGVHHSPKTNFFVVWPVRGGTR